MQIQRFDTNARLSRVVVHGDTAYFSGLTADDRSKDAEGQTAEILAKTDSYLETLGVTRNAVLSATIWLRDPDRYRRIAVVPGSLCIAAMGLYWMAQRIFLQ